jgi:hypothetical protein
VRTSCGLLISLMSLTLASGCAPRHYAPRIYQLSAPFIPEEYQPYRSPGTSTISGQAFMKTRGGDVKLGAGSAVVLCPVTTYSREWFQVRVLQDVPTSTPDERTAQFTRTAIADSQGRFRFSGLPAGEYFIACYIRWEVPSEFGLMPAGGWAYCKSHVDSSETSEIVATRPDMTTLSKLTSPPTGPDSVVTEGLFLVKVESGEVIAARSVRLRAGSVEIQTAEGRVIYRNPSKVLAILDADGRNWSESVLSAGVSLGK